MHKLSLLLALFALSYGNIPGHSQDRSPRIYLLEHPELVRLELLPRRLELNEDSEVLRAPYPTGAKIYFRVQATNTSLQKVTLFIIDTYFQDRPELFRDGQIVPYKKGVDDLLRAKDKQPFTRLVESVNV